MASATAVSRRRGRRPRAIVAVLLVLAAVVVAAELAARAIVPQVVRDQLVSNLGLAEGQEIDVDIPGILLPQLVIGSFAEMTLQADDVEIDGLQGDVRVTVQDAPVRDGGDWSGGQARLTLDEDQTRELLARVDGFPTEAFRLDPPEVALDTELSLFGASVPLGVRLSATAEGGELILSPTSFVLAGREISAEALRQQVGPILGSFAENWPVCVAQYVPAALTLTEVQVADSGVVASFEIDSAILRDETARQPGTCADDA